MELRSGSISGTKTENSIPDSNTEMEMIEDILTSEVDPENCRSISSRLAILQISI